METMFQPRVSLKDCHGIQTHNHLVRIWTLNYLAKFAFFFFFFCTAIWLGHSWGDSLTKPMLITALVQFPPKGCGDPRNEAGPLSRASALWGLNREPSDLSCNTLTHKATLLQEFGLSGQLG